MTDRTDIAVWQPIETAPKDGTSFQARIAGWGDDYIILWDTLIGAWMIASEQEPPDCWTCGYWWPKNEDEDMSAPVTHWKPLPPAPEAPAMTRTDTERLDWLATNECDLIYDARFGWGLYEFRTGMLGERRNIRHAIDAAMDGEERGDE